MAELFGGWGFNVTRLNTAPYSLQRSFVVRSARLLRVGDAILGIKRFKGANRKGAVYFSLSGGWGIIYEAIMSFVAKGRESRLIFHHHSFRYLDSWFWPMAFLVRLAGRDALHVVLGDEMEKLLRKKYSGVRTTCVLSNAIFVSPPSVTRGAREGDCRAIGFLANLSVAKGIADVLELSRLAERSGSDIRFNIAGPFENKGVERAFLKESRLLKNLFYVGPVYGDAKRQFFESIDIFVFPTRYRNEAEPLVVIEALSYGRPVLAYERGCIRSLVTPDCGCTIPRDAHFAESAWRVLQHWQKTNRLPELRQGASARFLDLRAEAEKAADFIAGFASEV